MVPQKILKKKLQSTWNPSYLPPTLKHELKLLIVGSLLFTEKSMLVLSFKQKYLPLLVSISFTRLIRILLLLLPWMQCHGGRWRENKKSSSTKGHCFGVRRSVCWLSVQKSWCSTEILVLPFLCAVGLALGRCSTYRWWFSQSKCNVFFSKVPKKEQFTMYTRQPCAGNQ